MHCNACSIQCCDSSPSGCDNYPCCCSSTNYTQNSHENGFEKCSNCTSEFLTFREPLDVTCADACGYLCPACHTEVPNFAYDIAENSCYRCPKCSTDIVHFYDQYKKDAKFIDTSDPSRRKIFHVNDKYKSDIKLIRSENMPFARCLAPENVYSLYGNELGDWFTRYLKRKSIQNDPTRQSFIDAWLNEIFKLLVLEYDICCNLKGYGESTQNLGSSHRFDWSIGFPRKRRAKKRFSKRWFKRHSSHYNLAVNPKPSEDDLKLFNSSIESTPSEEDLHESFIPEAMLKTIRSSVSEPTLNIEHSKTSLPNLIVSHNSLTHMPHTHLSKKKRKKLITLQSWKMWRRNHYKPKKMSTTSEVINFDTNKDELDQTQQNQIDAGTNSKKERISRKQSKQVEIDDKRNDKSPRMSYLPLASYSTETLRVSMIPFLKHKKKSSRIRD